ncbi:hypothetical protein GS504_15765 [Rhodococcus hoagii]|nr:hypothetical protein [Prescottella equi]
MRPKPRPTPEPQVSLPGDVALTFRNLDEIGQTDDGRLYLGDPSNLVDTNPPAAEPDPKSINVRSSW